MDDQVLSQALLEAARRLHHMAGMESTAQALDHLSTAFRRLRFDVPATMAADDDAFGSHHTTGEHERHSTMVEDPSMLEGLGLAANRSAEALKVATATLPEPGPQIDRLEAGSELGRGGMGRVVEAFDPLLHRKVAVKFLLDPRNVTPRRLARFIAEAQITAQLDHPNIVPVHEFGLSVAGDVYLIMKRVRGRSLRDVLLAHIAGDQKTHRDWDRRKILRAFWHVCQALAYAHGRGVLHRDLKPDNIMLGDFGEVYVMDWGVARIMGQPELLPEATERPRSIVRRLNSPTTLDGSSIGTPGYMSPEQTEGHFDQLTPASDIWSLGAILYEVLTLRPAFDAPSAMETVIMAATYDIPPDPSAVPLSDPIPPELAHICTRALARLSTDRFPDAQALAAAVEAFLDGSTRREAAEHQLAFALSAWNKHQHLDLQLQAEAAAVEALQHFFAPHTPRLEKAPLLELQNTRHTLKLQRARAMQDTVAACERALSQDPDHAPSRKLLTEVYWHRLQEAEAANDHFGARLHASRITTYGSLDDRILLEGTGRLSLSTSPPGAKVFCQRVLRQGLIWSLSAPEPLGITPLQRVPLDMGSYLLTIHHPQPENPHTLYPLHISRTRHWESPSIPLYTAADIPPGFVYIPAGPALLGGDPRAVGPLEGKERWVDGFMIASHPVSFGEYCDFINATLAAEGFDVAWARIPRQTPTSGQRWARPAAGGAFVVPRVDDDGELCDASWPVHGISWNDALAFCRWRSKRDQRRYTLPTEHQWEKAARGVDGRAFPWGDGFDATLCKMRQSRPGRPLPESNGAFPTDRSPYGVFDMAGSIREWCADPAFNHDPERRALRGGSWLDEPYLCRLASRCGLPPSFVSPDTGFRLVYTPETDRG